ncbi:MAG: DinB family protein [Candidatus Zixiibacteriota bacterium]|nr:MAG: DinB family protein [candidate division Zixibacteria bacterium]
MSIQKHLLYMLHLNQEVTRKLVDDINEEESMARGPGRHNHIRWQVGHLLYSLNYTKTLLGDQESDYSSFEKLYGGGSEVSDDPSAYPSLSELKEQLYAAHQAAISLVEGIAEPDLTKEIGEGERKSHVWQAVTFLCMHEFYHNGQITHIRKALGRERPFG